MRSVAIGPDSNETRMSSSVTLNISVSITILWAMFTKVLTPPKSLTTSFTADAQAAGSVTSHSIERSHPLGARDAFKAKGTTVAPSLVRARHTPLPTLPVPPVTTATSPLINRTLLAQSCRTAHDAAAGARRSADMERRGPERATISPAGGGNIVTEPA